MSNFLKDLSPSITSQAYDANDSAFWKLLFGHFPKTIFHDDPGILWFETGIQHDVFNQVIQTHLEPAILHSTLDRVLGSFQERHLPFLYLVGPTSSPPDLERLLQEHKLIHHATEPVMAIHLSEINENIPTASQLILQPVTTKEQLRRWVEIWEIDSPEDVINLWFTLYSHVCFESESPLRLFIGLLDGNLISTSAVYFGSEVASFGSIGTLASHRCQGIGAAMTLAVLQEARKQGYQIGVLLASSMGISIYRRIGFQEIGTSSTYLWHPPD